MRVGAGSPGVHARSWRSVLAACFSPFSVKWLGSRSTNRRVTETAEDRLLAQCRNTLCGSHCTVSWRKDCPQVSVGLPAGGSCSRCAGLITHDQWYNLHGSETEVFGEVSRSGRGQGSVHTGGLRVQRDFFPCFQSKESGFQSFWKRLIGI